MKGTKVVDGLALDYFIFVFGKQKIICMYKSTDTYTYTAQVFFIFSGKHHFLVLGLLLEVLLTSHKEMF